MNIIIVNSKGGASKSTTAYQVASTYFLRDSKNKTKEENKNLENQKTKTSLNTPAQNAQTAQIYSEVTGYQGALNCVFCNQTIVDDDWTRDDFTWDKPAHNSCYDRKKDELANQDERG